MDPLFNPEEHQSRRQFRELFLGKFLCPVAKGQAFHDMPWDSGILDIVLHDVYDDNLLDREAVEVIMQLCGIYDREGDAWFGLGAITPTPDIIVDAIAPYISAKAYLTLRKQNNSLVFNSVERFYQTVCCGSPNRKERIRQADVFKLYQEWCNAVNLPIESRRTFRNVFESHPVGRGKGYVEGVSGTTYYTLSLRTDEEAWNAQSERAATQERQKAAHSEQSVWNELRRRAPIRQDPFQGEEETVPSDEGRQDTTTGSGGIFPDDETVDSGAEEVVPEFQHGISDEAFTTPGDSDAIDTTEDSADSIPEDGVTGISDNTAEGAEAEPESGDSIDPNDPVNIRNKVKGLPSELRKFFKLMKVTYLVNPEHFQFNDFQAYYNTSDFPAMQLDKLNDLYILFVQYAKLK